MKTLILSAPGRASTTGAMLTALARQNPGATFEIFRASGTGAVADWRAMLEQAAAAGGDLLALEDDIVTARHFLLYAAWWQSPHVTSFFHPAMGGAGIRKADGFSFSQAVKFPAALLRRLLELPRPVHTGAQDDELGMLLRALGEPVHYHRSLVQHVGATSLLWGERYPLAARVAADFPGEDFDCLKGCP